MKIERADDLVHTVLRVVLEVLPDASASTIYANERRIRSELGGQRRYVSRATRAELAERDARAAAKRQATSTLRSRLRGACAILCGSGAEIRTHALRSSERIKIEPSGSK